jgi:hypothetical protein
MRPSGEGPGSGLESYASNSGMTYVTVHNSGYEHKSGRGKTGPDTTARS